MTSVRRYRLHVTLTEERYRRLSALAGRLGYRSPSSFARLLLGGVVDRATKGTQQRGDVEEMFSECEDWERDPSHVFAPSIRKRT